MADIKKLKRVNKINAFALNFVNLGFVLNKKRYQKIDAIRGVALLNMIAYHAMWDLVYLYDIECSWYQSTTGYRWQQGICWTFIFLSGFCLPLGSHAIKRGILVSVGGAVIMAVTWIFMPQSRVVFGVLTLIGSCMLFAGAFEKWLKRMPPLLGAAASSILFAFTRNVNDGSLGFARLDMIKLPESLYANILTAYLGFPERGFYSTDYFSIVPWLFLFMTGYFVCRYLRNRKIMECMKTSVLKPIEWLGRHSFEIYMLHQPVIYLILEVIFRYIVVKR